MLEVFKCRIVVFQPSPFYVFSYSYSQKRKFVVFLDEKKYITAKTSHKLHTHVLDVYYLGYTAPEA